MAHRYFRLFLARVCSCSGPGPCLECCFVNDLVEMDVSQIVMRAGNVIESRVNVVAAHGVLRMVLLVHVLAFQLCKWRRSTAIEVDANDKIQREMIKKILLTNT